MLRVFALVCILYSCFEECQEHVSLPKWVLYDTGSPISCRDVPEGPANSSHLVEVEQAYVRCQRVEVFVFRILT